MRITEEDVNKLLDEQYDVSINETATVETRSRDVFPTSPEHERSVRKALSEGKPVPAEVLAEYPDLQQKVPDIGSPQKQPWEMTREEWLSISESRTRVKRTDEVRLGLNIHKTPYGKTWSQEHHNSVKQALSKGKPVPAEVLADYPDLQQGLTKEPAKVDNVSEKVDNEAVESDTQKTTPEELNFTQFAKKYGYTSDYDITDHSALSPSGRDRISKRDKKYRDQALLDRIQSNKDGHEAYRNAIRDGSIIDPDGKITKEKLHNEERDSIIKDAESEIKIAEGQIDFIRSLGSMAYTKSGKMKVGYQRSVDDYLDKIEKAKSRIKSVRHSAAQSKETPKPRQSVQQAPSAQSTPTGKQNSQSEPKVASNDAGSAKKPNGWVWIKEQQLPFTSWREIAKGKNAGKVAVNLRGREVIVDKSKVEVWPEESAAPEKKTDQPAESVRAETDGAALDGGPTTKKTGTNGGIDHSRIKRGDMIKFKLGDRVWSEMVLQVFGDNHGPISNTYQVDVFGDKFIKHEDVEAVKHKNGDIQKRSP